MLLIGISLLIVSVVISRITELGDFRWALLFVIGILTSAWMFTRLVIRPVLLMNPANAQRRTGIMLAKIAPRLKQLRGNYLAQFRARHGRPGHSSGRLSAARSDVSSRSFFGSRAVLTHEEIHEHWFEI
jgi:hypothetical protein